MANAKYNWEEILTEYLDGEYNSIQEFVEHCMAQGNGYPSASSIYKKSSEDGWVEQKKDAQAQKLHRYLNEKLSKAEQRDIEHALQLNRRLTMSQMKLVDTVIARIAKGDNMEGIRININFSDAINDLKRSLGERTREHDSNATVNIQNNQIDQGSFRARIEQMSPEELSRFQDEEDDEDIKTIDIEAGEIEFTDLSDEEDEEENDG